MNGISPVRFKTQGRVLSGLGRGAQFLSIGWVRSELRDRLGFDPFPGTLNLKIDPDLWNTIYSNRDSLLKISDPASSTCPGFLKRVRLQAGKERSCFAYLILPELTMYKDVLEIVAPESLREKLGLQDGDAVTIEDA